MARTIELKVIDTGMANTGDGEEVKRPNFLYRESLLQLISGQVQEGLTIAQTAALLKPYRKIEEAKDGDIVTLEDAEYDTLQEQLKRVRLITFNPWLAQMTQELDEAPEMKIGSMSANGDGPEVETEDPSTM